MATFKKRTTEPERSNRYYYADNPFQGENSLPNCTCYAYGRFWEITGEEPNLSTSNAIDWYYYTSDGYKRGQTPKLGAVMCWKWGNYGHVAIVEEIKSNGDVVTTESAHGGEKFKRCTYLKSNGYSDYSRGLYFIGFIYCGIDFSDSVEDAYSGGTSEAEKILNPSSRDATWEVDEELIWKFLILKIKNPYGVAGVMGNLYWESGLSSVNLQQSYESYLGYGDKSYTEAVDNGSYSKSRFVSDAAGYGLAQWTASSRKQGLYEYCVLKKASIGNLTTQLEFLMKELTAGYGGVLPVLKNATNITEASNKFLYDFETPEIEESTERIRSEQGLEYYTKYKHITADSLGKITEEKKEVTEKTEKKKVKLIFDMVLVGKIED